MLYLEAIAYLREEGRVIVEANELLFAKLKIGAKPSAKMSPTRVCRGVLFFLGIMPYE